MSVTLEDIHIARHKLSGVSDLTPLNYSHTLSELSRNHIYMKLENLQRTGSFKIRGAYNKISGLEPSAREAGVIAASAGNHAQGVAYAARMLGIPCQIVMPIGASLSKIEATKRYGAQVLLSGETYDDAYAKAKELREQTGMTFIHAFDDETVVAGQGTIGLEILEQEPEIDAILVPVGGGGLIAGIATAVKALRPSVAVYGVEARGASCMRTSLDAKELVTLARVSTIADGIAVKRLGEVPWKAAVDLVDDVFVVEDEQIARAMVLLIERSKVVSEGAGAVGVAALLAGAIPLVGKKIAVVLSGGNVDVSLLSRIIEHGLAAAGRHTRIVTTLPDRPGALSALVAAIADTGANILSIEHHRLGQSIILGEAEVELSLETRNADHVQSLMDRFRSLGYTFHTR